MNNFYEFFFLQFHVVKKIIWKKNFSIISALFFYKLLFYAFRTFNIMSILMRLCWKLGDIDRLVINII